MARVSSKYTCTACEAKLAVNETTCARCGHPTPHATMEQRVLWELNRWQESREDAAPREAHVADAPVRHVARGHSVETPRHTVETPRHTVVAETRQAIVADARGPVVAAGNGAAAAAAAYEIADDAETLPDLPLVVHRLPVNPQANGTAVVEAVPTPVKERRKDRKAREAAEKAEREAAAKQAAEAERDAARLRKEEAERAKQEAARAKAAEDAAGKAAEKAERAAAKNAKPSRAERRSAKKYKRLTEGITLHDGETITKTLSGWSRGRPAVLVITRYRVALITRLPHSLRWIPLEEVSKSALRWRGGWTLEIEGSVEYLTLQKRSKQTLGAVRELLMSEVAEARAPGGRRHHPEVTQDWCDRSIEMWETHAGQLRLFIRRHPVLVVATLSVWVPVAYYFALR